MATNATHAKALAVAIVGGGPAALPIISRVRSIVGEVRGTEGEVVLIDTNRRPRGVLVGLVTRAFVATLIATWALFGAAAPRAQAEPCPDVEVVFARGTDEPPGVGGIGQGFIDALRSKTGARSVDAYAVNYAASDDFGDPLQFAMSVIDGIRDASNHIQSTAAACPSTRIVLGGFSQGAAVAGFVTSPEVPPGVPAAFVPPPMPPEIADHVAAVTLFGKPSNRFLSDSGAPQITIGPLYVPKTTDLCATGDTICNGAPPGPPTAAHGSYVANGMAAQAASFVAGRL